MFIFKFIFCFLNTCLVALGFEIDIESHEMLDIKGTNLPFHHIPKMLYWVDLLTLGAILVQ